MQTLTEELYSILTNPPCNARLFSLMDEAVTQDYDAAHDAWCNAISRLTPEQFSAVESVLNCVLSSCFSMDDPTVQ